MFTYCCGTHCSNTYMYSLKRLVYRLPLGEKHRPLVSKLDELLSTSEDFITPEWRWVPNCGGRNFMRVTEIASNNNYFLPFKADVTVDQVFNVPIPKKHSMPMTNPIETGNRLHSALAEVLQSDAGRHKFKLPNPGVSSDADHTRDPFTASVFPGVLAWMRSAKLRPAAVEYPMAFRITRGGSTVHARGVADALFKDSKSRLVVLELKTHMSQKWRISDQPRAGQAQALLYHAALHAAGIPVARSVVLHITIADGRVQAETHTLATTNPDRYLPHTVQVGELTGEGPGGPEQRITELEAAVETLGGTVLELQRGLDAMKSEMQLYRARLFGAPPSDSGNGVAGIPQAVIDSRHASMPVLPVTDAALQMADVQVGIAALSVDPAPAAPVPPPPSPPGVRATTAAIHLAEEAGVDLETVEGTGLHGRVTSPDVARARDSMTSLPG